MSSLEDSKQKLSEVFSRLERLIDQKLMQGKYHDSTDLGAADEMLKKANQSLLEQNSVLQKKLFELENKYHELQRINKKNSAQIDSVIANLKNLISK